MSLSSPKDSNKEMQIRSEMQLQKQRRESLIKYAATAQEKQICAAMNTKRFGEFNKQDMGELIEAIGVMGYYVGLSKSVTGDDILLLAKFLVKSYPALSMGEFKLAVELNTKMAFGEIHHYGVFSPMYLSKVIDAYSEFRATAMRLVFERQDRAEAEQHNSGISREESHQMMIQMVATEFQKFKATGKVDDFFSIIYYFLKKTGRLVLTPEVEEAAKKYAEEIVAANRRRKADADFSEAAKRLYIQDEKVAYRIGCRNYCVQHVFSQVEDIDKYVSEIKIEEV